MAARYAVNELGLQYLGVISPANQNGEIQTDAFIKEVDLLGGTVVISEWYSGEPKNLKRQFKNIRRIAFNLYLKKKIMMKLWVCLSIALMLFLIYPQKITSIYLRRKKRR